MFGSPQFRFRHLQPQRTVGHTLGCRDGLAAVGEHCLHYAAVVVGTATQGELHTAVADIGSRRDMGDMVLRHRFQPHGLPDAADGGVPNRVRREGLLADRLVALVGGVVDTHHQFLAAFAMEIWCNVETEGGVATLVASYMDVVHIDIRLPIHCAEVQHHPLALPSGRHHKLAVVPQLLFLGQRLLNARQLRLHTIGHRYPTVPFCRCDTALV